MKTATLSVTLFALILLAVGPARAGSPGLLDFSGRLGTEAGDFTGEAYVTLTLYDHAFASEPEHTLWVETTHLYVQDGRFHVLLGDDPSNPLPVDLAAVSELFVGVRVGDDEEMTPRLRVASVPFSLHANDADTLAGQPAGAFAAADHGHALSALQGPLAETQLPASVVLSWQVEALLDAKADVDHEHEGLVQAGQPDSVTGDMVSDGSLTPADLGGGGCADGELLIWGAAAEAWGCGAASAGGSYTAGTGLLLTDGTFSLDAATVGNWAKSVCFDKNEELHAALDQRYAAAAHEHEAYVAAGAADSVTSPMVTDGSLLFADIARNGCQTDDVMKWTDAAGWACATDDTRSQPVVEGWARGVAYDSSDELADALPGWDQDASDDLTRATVFAGAVTGAHDGLTLTAGAVDTGHLASYAVTGDKLADGAVSSDKLQPGAVAFTHIGGNGCVGGRIMKRMELPSGSSVWACAEDANNVYTPGAGLMLSQGQFSVNQASVESWAQGVCYDSPYELQVAAPTWDQDASDDLSTSTQFGGNLSGTYANLTVKSGVIGNAQISATAAIEPHKIQGTAWTQMTDGPNSGMNADLLDGLQAAELAAADHTHDGFQAAYARVVSVSPVLGAGGVPNPDASGQALLLALDDITGASSDDRYLLRLEPGRYDLGQAALAMKPYVDIQGAGRDLTILRADGEAGAAPTDGAVIGAQDATLADLTVLNEGAGALATAFFADDVDTQLVNVRLHAQGGTSAVYAAYVIGPDAPSFQDVWFSGVGSGSVPLIGLSLTSASPRITGSRFVMEGTNNIVGIQAYQSSPELQGTRISVKGSDDLLGLDWWGGGNPRLQDCRVSVTGAGSSAGVVGIRGSNGGPILHDVFVSTTDFQSVATTYGIYLNNVSSPVLSRLTLRVSGGSVATGLHLASTTEATVSFADVKTTGASSCVGVLGIQAGLTLTHSQIEAAGPGGVGVQNLISSGTFRTVQVTHSRITGAPTAIAGTSATITKVAQSHLSGAVSNATCAGVTDSAYQFHASACP